MEGYESLIWEWKAKKVDIYIQTTPRTCMLGVSLPYTFPLFDSSFSLSARLCWTKYKCKSLLLVQQASSCIILWVLWVKLELLFLWGSLWLLAQLKLVPQHLWCLTTRKLIQHSNQGWFKKEKKRVILKEFIVLGFLRLNFYSLTIRKEKMYFSFCTWVAITSMKSIFGAVCTIDCSQTRDKNNVLIIWKFVLKVCMNKFKKSFLLNSCPVPKGLNTNVTTMLNILQVIFTIPKVTTFKMQILPFFNPSLPEIYYSNYPENLQPYSSNPTIVNLVVKNQPIQQHIPISLSYVSTSGADCLQLLVSLFTHWD